MTTRDPEMDDLHWKLMELSKAQFDLARVLHQAGVLGEGTDPGKVPGLQDAYSRMHDRFFAVAEKLDAIIPGGCPGS